MGTWKSGALPTYILNFLRLTAFSIFNTRILSGGEKLLALWTCCEKRSLPAHKIFFGRMVFRLIAPVIRKCVTPLRKEGIRKAAQNTGNCQRKCPLAGRKIQTNQRKRYARIKIQIAPVAPHGGAQTTQSGARSATTNYSKSLHFQKNTNYPMRYAPH